MKKIVEKGKVDLFNITQKYLNNSHDNDTPNFY